MSKWFIQLLRGASMAFAGAAFLPALSGSPHLQGFEMPTFAAGGNPTYASQNWNSYDSAVVRTASGTDGIVSRSGAYHGVLDSTGVSTFTGAFTRLGGYSSSYRHGFRTAVDVYIDLSAPEVGADTYGWDLSTAANNQAGSHRRDFIFHSASNASGDVLIGASNNSNFTRRNDLASINHLTITSSGWYTFEWTFRDWGDGTLAVDMRVRDTLGNQLFLETRHDASDSLSTNVGGNRYMWFTFLEVNKLAIDNNQVDQPLDDGLPIDLNGNYFGMSGTGFLWGNVAFAATRDVVAYGFFPGQGQVGEGGYYVAGNPLDYGLAAFKEATYTPFSDAVKPPTPLQIDMTGRSMRMDIELAGTWNTSWDSFTIYADGESSAWTGGVFWKEAGGYAFQMWGAEPSQTGPYYHEDSTGATRFRVQWNVAANGAQSGSITTLDGSAPGTIAYFDTNDGNQPFYTSGANSFLVGLHSYGDSKAVARVTNWVTNAGNNALYAYANDPYVQTGNTITYGLGMSGLQQTVFGFQAFCSYSGSQSFLSGSYSASPFSQYVISPITSVLDYSAGRGFGLGATAMNAALGDALFTATGAGTAQMLIDFSNGVIPTQFSDSMGGPVAPNRLNSNIVVIDDTATYANVDSAMQTAGNVLGGTAIAGPITFNVTSYDNGAPGTEGAGLTNYPTMSLQFASGPAIPLSVCSTGPNTFAASYTIPANAPCGIATISVTSTDDSGNVTLDSDTFDVNTATVTFNLTLDGASFTGSAVRGIEFVLGGTGGANAPVVINKNVTFTTGAGNTQAIVLNALDGVPCSEDLTRMSVKDKKHTIRKLVVLSNGGSGEQYTTADVHLKSGDATNDNVIDILDYGVFASMFGSSPGLSTPVGYIPLHPDFSGDGSVGTADYSFIGNVGQYLSVGDAMPGNYSPTRKPKERATVKELLAAGATRAAEFDANRDGWVTFEEITKWLRNR